MMRVEITTPAGRWLSADGATLAAVRAAIGSAVEDYAATLPDDERERFYAATVGPLNLAMGGDRLAVAIQVDETWSYQDDTVAIRVSGTPGHDGAPPHIT